MNYDILEAMQPILINIAKRTEQMWPKHNYDLIREITDFHALAYVFGGEGSLEVNGARYALRKGVMFYVPASSRMRITTEASNPVQYYSVLFHYGELRWEGISGAWKESTFKPLPISSAFLIRDNLEVSEIYLRLIEMWNGNQPGYRWHCKMEFLQLLYRIMRWVQEDSQDTKQSAALVDSIIVHLRNHLSEPFDRTAIAAKLALSPGYFSVLFKQHTGLTPVEYVMQLRIDRAKQLLVNSDMPVRRIAEEVGYPDPLYFTRIFTRETGISPRKFRRL